MQPSPKLQVLSIWVCRFRGPPPQKKKQTYYVLLVSLKAPLKMGTNSKQSQTHLPWPRFFSRSVRGDQPRREVLQAAGVSGMLSLLETVNICLRLEGSRFTFEFKRAPRAFKFNPRRSGDLSLGDLFLSA